MSNQKASAKMVVAADREAKALELRKAGATYKQIGGQLGITEMGAHKAVQRALSKLRSGTAELAEELVTLETARLDTLLLGVWSAAKNGGLTAVDRVLRIMERRAKLLGLDSATRTEISGPAGTPIQIEQKADLAKLSDSELETLLALVEKAAAPAAE